MNATRLLEHFDRISDAADAVTRLRQMILALAVRGCLVPQDPAEEPAQSRSTKARTNPDSIGPPRSRRTTTTRHDEPKDSTCDVPLGWTQVSLSDVTVKITDGAHKTPTYVDKGVPFVSVKDFSRGALDLTNTRFIPADEHETLYRRCDPKRGDILLGRIGTLGKAVVVDTDIEFSLFVSVALLRFDHQVLLPGFFKMALNSPVMAAEFDRVKIGGATHTNKLNLGDLKTLPMWLPPLAEQQRIVAKVDELMALCDRLEAAQAEREARRDRLVAASLARVSQPAAADAASDARAAGFHLDHFARLTTRPEHVKHLRQTILNLAVRGRLVPQDPVDPPAVEAAEFLDQAPFSLPPEWRWVPLAEICSKTGSGSTPRGGKDAYKRTGVPFLRSQNIHDDGLRFDDVAYIDAETHTRMEGTVVRPGDLLLNITGGSMGRCCRIPDDFTQANVSQHVAIIRVRAVGVPDYLHKCILSPFWQAMIFDEQTGAGRGGLPKNKMDRLPIPLPPLAEQRRIVAKVDELMTLCDQLEASLAAAATDRARLLESLLHEALAPAA